MAEVLTNLERDRSADSKSPESEAVGVLSTKRRSSAVTRGGVQDSNGGEGPLRFFVKPQHESILRARQDVRQSIRNAAQFEGESLNREEPLWSRCVQQEV